MSKKFIAALIAATLLFVGVFAACEKKDPEAEEETRVYAEDNEFEFVTDENGEKVLSKDGEFYVYVTDESGEVVVDEDGEPETVVQQFVPIKEDNYVEYYGYSVTLPDNWEADSSPNNFINEKENEKLSIKPIPVTEYSSYEEYYRKQKETYEQLVGQKGVTVTWEEDVDFAKGCKNVVKFTMTIESEEGSGMNIMYFFENNGNLYKILFESADPKTAEAACDEFVSAIKYKPYKYFDEETTES